MGDLFEGGLTALVGAANGEVVAKRFVSVRLQFSFAVQPLCIGHGSGRVLSWRKRKGGIFSDPASCVWGNFSFLETYRTQAGYAAEHRQGHAQHGRVEPPSGTLFAGRNLRLQEP